MTYKNKDRELLSANPSAENGTGKQSAAPVVTPAMVEAASDVLRESGLLEYFPEGPAQLVIREMLLAAFRETRA